MSSIFESNANAESAPRSTFSRLRTILHGILKFDLRFMLFGTALCAVAVAWWLDRRSLEQRIVVIETTLNPSRVMGTSWSVDQATGPPNVTRLGDNPAAWASQTPDTQPEWLELTYASFVRPTEVEVYETYNPGAITKITAFDQSGGEFVIWSDKQSKPAAKTNGSTRFPVTNGFSTNRVKLHIASDKVAGWNEIDAVGMHYRGWIPGVIWAQSAKASSSYGQSGFGISRGQTMMFTY